MDKVSSYGIQMILDFCAFAVKEPVFYLFCFLVLVYSACLFRKLVER